MGDVHGEGGLADAADARQRGDRHHAAGVPAPVPGRGGQYVAQLAHEGGPAREVGHRGRELCRTHGGRHRLRGRGRRLGEAGVGLEDALLEFLEAGAGVDAEFVGEQAPRVRVDREGLRLAAAAVQGQHQQLAQALPQRVLRRERRQLRDRLRVAALLQVHVQAGFEELQPPLLKTDALRLRVGPRNARQHLAVPQRERAAQEVTGVAQVPRGPRLLGAGGQVLGRREVQRPLGETAHGVPAGLAHQDPGVQDLPQPGRVRAHRRQRLRRRFLAPQGVDQFGRRRRAALAEQQRGQQRALLRGAGGQRPLAPPGPHRSEHAEPERGRPVRLRRGSGTPLLRNPRSTVHAVVPLDILSNQASLPCSCRPRQPWETPITRFSPAP